MQYIYIYTLHILYVDVGVHIRYINNKQRILYSCTCLDKHEYTLKQLSNLTQSQNHSAEINCTDLHVNFACVHCHPTNQNGLVSNSSSVRFSWVVDLMFLDMDIVIMSSV